MIRLIIKKIKRFSGPGINHNLILSELKAIRSRSGTLAIYGSPTGSSYLGIANATKNLYPTNSLQIPQYYSTCLLNSKQLTSITQAINSLQFEKVILSGFAPYFFDIADKLQKPTTVTALYHGTISEFHYDTNKSFITELVSRAKKGIFAEIAFVSEGLDFIFNKLFNIKTSHQALITPVKKGNLKKLDLDRSKIHIGVFGSETFNKNLHNQVIHALLIDNVIVHVLDRSAFDYLGMPGRIVGHGTDLPQEKFLNVLGSMDLNLYMSFNESYGLVAAESELLGVKCVKFPEVDYLESIRKNLDKK